MPRHRSRRRLSGGFTAVAETGLPCTKEERLSFKTIALSVPTSCIDRVPACDHKNLVIVTASCPSKGAALMFEKKVGRIAQVLAEARGILRRAK